MALSNDQLSTWTNAPASTKSQFTHEEVRKALAQSEALRGKDYDVYLQGSYANSTNIRVDSDIDIVVQLNSTFNPDRTRLTPAEASLQLLSYPAATYHFPDFRRDVLAALRTYFGVASVTEGRKCIKVRGDARRVNADVIPALQHKQYLSFSHAAPNNFVEGVKFWTTDNREIVNYPKLHLANGENKNHAHRTDQKYKHLVRIMKNIRRRLVDEKGFNPDLARSYFVECAVYNVPDGHFNGDYKTSLEYVLDHILHRCAPAQLLTVSHQHVLFGNEPWQWNTAHAGTFFQAVEDYYKNN